MENLSQIICDLKEYTSICKHITNSTSNTLVNGVSHIHKANIISAINTQFLRQTLVITTNDACAKRLADDIFAFTGKKPLLLRSKDFVFHNILSASKESVQSRIEVLSKLKGFKGVIVATIDSLLSATLPPQILKQASFKISVGESYDIKNLSNKLVQAGYVRRMQVDGVCQFSLRGGILDIFPVGRVTPVRIEFFDDEVDTIANFKIDTQRRETNIDSVSILPAMEVLPHFAQGGIEQIVQSLKSVLDLKIKKELEANIRKDIDRFENEGTFPTVDRYLKLIYKETFTALDYLSSNALVFFDDTHKVVEQAKVYFKRNSEDLISLIERGVIIGQNIDYFLDFNSLLVKIRNKNIIMLDTFLQNNEFIEPLNIINIKAKQLPAYASNIELAKEDIMHYNKNGYKVIVLCKGDLRAKNMAEILTGLPVKITREPKGPLSIIDNSVSSGFEYPDIKLAVITEGQILSKQKTKKTRKSNRQHVKSYADLTIGDIIVHEHHGIGRFSGIEKMLIDGFERDYVKISFAGTDTLFVSISNLDLISKYIGSNGEESKVRLNKLGGTEWQKAKSKAKGSAKDLAKYLTDLYAKRSKLEGFSFNKDDVWQDDFEQSFIYDETDDQLRSVEEIKSDMEKPTPMDRLLCGDVGFGKTEVAFRAIMKCILSGKQSAILVPTTVLARQHYLTAMQRFNGFPITIEFFSRFKTPAEQKIILQRLLEGNIDLIIGTHKLFNKALKFKDLGLLVVDEEQRFGVAHKEKLKELGPQIDVLTLSATPIPRTLNMALSGIRDMSVLEEAPHNRQPIETYVLEYDFAIIIDAIRRELDRNGQCFYLHNRIDSIDTVAYKLKLELPDIVIEVAHGKMSQKQLSTIMEKMNAGEIDVLVATTIIETGIDVSNANTLIIENADHMGLAQLHQIRGRVGRSNRVAYSYLTYKTGKSLSEIATKRLSAIREFAEFGSGFKIAMRDLEIRGAGSVLGSAQSGHLTNIGYDLYLKLLEEAVLEEKGLSPEKIVECTIDINLSASIPESFINDIAQRIDLYRKIATIKSEVQLSDVLDEIIDRYSEPPKSVLNLCHVAKVKNIASTKDIQTIKQKDGRLIIEFENPNIEKMSKLCGNFNGRMMLSAGIAPYLVVNLQPKDDVLRLCDEFLSYL